MALLTFACQRLFPQQPNISLPILCLQWAKVYASPIQNARPVHICNNPKPLHKSMCVCIQAGAVNDDQGSNDDNDSDGKGRDLEKELLDQDKDGAYCDWRLSFGDGVCLVYAI